MSNVVTLHGRETIGDQLRRYAEQADKGEVVAYGIAIVRPEKRVGTEFDNPSMYGHELLSAVTILQNRIVNSVDETITSDG